MTPQHLFFYALVGERRLFSNEEDVSIVRLFVHSVDVCVVRLVIETRRYRYVRDRWRIAKKTSRL